MTVTHLAKAAFGLDFHRHLSFSTLQARRYGDLIP
jgi:hypothetical protein